MELPTLSTKLLNLTPNFYKIKNSTNNNVIKPFSEIICL